MTSQYNEKLITKITNAIKNNDNYYILLNSLSIENNKVSMRALETHANHTIKVPGDILVFYKAVEKIKESLEEKYKSITGNDINDIKCDCPNCTGKTDPRLEKALDKIVKAVSRDSNKKESLELIRSVMKMDDQERQLLIDNVNKATSTEEIKGLLRGC